MMRLFLWSIVLLSLGLSLSTVRAIIPQVSQQGLLRPYRSYADVTLFHYYVPKEVSRATFQFAAFMDSEKCSPKNVFVYLQHGSYPVISPDNGTFPKHLYTKRTSLYGITLISSFKPHDAAILPVYDPLPGSWFAAAYLPNWDQQVQQQGVGHRCRYSLGSVALWSQIATVEILPLHVTSRRTNDEHFKYFKFHVPSGVWDFNVRIDGCRFSVSHHFPERNGTMECIKNIFLRANALPRYQTPKDDSYSLSEAEDSFYFRREHLPVTDVYYYLLIVAESKVSYNITISTTECPMQVVGTTFLHQFLDVDIKISSKSQALKTDQSGNSNGSNPHPQQVSCPCLPMYHLTRIKHAQDFSDTFLLEGKEWFTTWLALTGGKAAVTKMELLPYMDIGGTLSVSVHLDEILINSSLPETHVYGCLRKGRPPESVCCSVNTVKSCCRKELSIHVMSSNHSGITDGIAIPFPEPGLWYMSFVAVCYSEGKVVPCQTEEVLVSLDIRTQPCVFSYTSHPRNPAAPCGKYGVCQEVHKGQFFYTSCRCIGGYKGWGCTDGSNATPHSELMAGVLLLTLSNLFFVPAIILAFRRKLYTQAFIYFVTMASSALYHACDQDIYSYCLTRYHVLQFCDFFCSYLSFWVTIIELGRCSAKYESVLYMVGAVVIAAGVEYNRTGLATFVIPITLGLGIPLFIWSYRCYQIRKVIVPKLNAVLLFFPGMFLGIAGLILYAFVETEDNYMYTHSAWHMIIALSLLYVLPLRRKQYNDLISRHEVTSSSELAAVRSGNNQSSSPVFFITSELDHLVEENVVANGHRPNHGH